MVVPKQLSAKLKARKAVVSNWTTGFSLGWVFWGV
jgi:hypothetical protein